MAILKERDGEIGTFYDIAEQGDVKGKESELQLLEKQDRLIRRVVLVALIPIVVAFSFIVFIFYRQRREAFFKQTEAELKLNIAEVEIRALRAQINPHFIFNCLNSIHHYMHRNNITEASQYLVKFSHLIRHILEASSSRMVPLADEITAVQNYMQLEQLRLDHSFEFEVTIAPSIDQAFMEIPPMLIQPFVENSIWHGLNSKGTGGRLHLMIERVGDMLKCTIEDNGVEGVVKKENDLTSGIKKTSMGLTLISERLALVSQLYNVKAEFALTDIIDVNNERIGKRVVLMLPFDE